MTASRKLSSPGARSWKTKVPPSIMDRPSVGVLGKTQPGKRPARRGREEIAIGGADMPGRGHRRAAAQHHLVRHELAVVFADRPGSGAEARIGGIGAGGPLPHVADHLA